MESLFQDVRYGLRMLVKSPGFTAVAVITLALGIGANTAIFSVVKAVLLKPLPFSDPDRLVNLWESDSHSPDDIMPVTPADFQDWRRGTRLLIAAVFRGAHRVVIDTSPDVRVLVFLLAVSLVAGVLFGLAPAWRAYRLDLVSSLKAGAQPGAAGLSGRTLSRLLVVSQLALSLVLVVGAGLLLRTLINLVRQDFGFDRQHLLLVNIDPQIGGYRTSQLASLYQRIRENVNALPGVRSSALALYTPLTTNWSGMVAIANYTPQQNKNAWAAWNRVSPRYFETMGIPVLLGRAVEPQDGANSPEIAVVNQTMARRYFAGQNPVGQRFGWDEGTRSEFEIVGVVKDTKHDEVRGEIPPMFFLPLTQSGKAVLPEDSAILRSTYVHDLVVRAAGDADSIANDVRRVLRETAPGLPITGVTTLKEQVNASLNTDELMAGLAAFFGSVALLLATLGVYGLMAYAVARRTPEIGVRMALGARPQDISGLIVLQALRMAAVGIALGIAAALGLTHLVTSLLFGVRAQDPITFVAVAALVAGVAFLASYVPARRAAKVDPMEALRYE